MQKMTFPIRYAATCALALGMSCAWAQDLGPTLQKIKETKSITLGYRESSVPFSFLDGEQKPVGFSMDLCAKIVDRIKEEVKLSDVEINKVAVNSSNRIPLVVNGTVDIECGGTANNLARQKQVSFSVATFASQPRWLVRTESGFKTPADLKGKTVVVTQGSNAVGFVRAANEKDKLGVNVIQAKDHGESMLTLANGRAVAFLEDDILLAGERANARDPSAFMFLEGGYAPGYYGLMFKKDDTQFKALVDGVITGMMKDGSFEELYRKWFESPIPPNNVSLDFPISERLRERIDSPSDKVDF
jgi:glutamate/aspartate transport system substrate-binding protein